MKKLILAAAFILSVTGVWAQKIDKRLTNLVEQTAQRRAQGLKKVLVINKGRVYINKQRWQEDRLNILYI